MRVGVLPSLDQESGGLYQYSLTFTEALFDLDTADEWYLFSADLRHPLFERVRDRQWTVLPVDPPTISGRVKRALRRLPGPAFDAGRRLATARSSRRIPVIDSPVRRKAHHEWLESVGIDLMLFPSPTALAFEVGLPFVMSVHDLQHRLQPNFPEVNAGGEYERREYLYRNASREALLLVADSETGREDLVHCYESEGLTPDRVRVLPFLPPPYVLDRRSDATLKQVLSTYGLPAEYLFYPAQFWPHKNHGRLVAALAQLKREGLQISVAFSGSKSGSLRTETFNAVIAEARLLGVEHQVHYLGYVPDRDLAPLYRGATALVMPTFFGPTNIPILEAWTCDCPVVTSRLRGMIEQAGDAAILVDPSSVEEIAHGIRRVCSDEDLRSSLVEAGRRRLRGYTPTDYRARLKDIIEEAQARVS